MSDTMNDHMLDAELVVSDSIKPTATINEGVWQALPLKARGIFVLIGVTWSAVIGGAIAFVASAIALSKYDYWIMISIMAILLALAFVCFGILLGRSQWKHTRWRLDHEGLHIQRGRWFRRETLVPHSRVQHLDLERGPLERRRGLATLIVHTAGTRTQAVSVPCLLDEQAINLRNAMVPRDSQVDEYVTSA
jgi:uncharacterized protein